jgi:hypothetical protein
MALRRRADKSVLERSNESDRRVLLLIPETLKEKVQELQTLLDDYLPKEDASSGRKIIKAMGSFGVEKKIDIVVKEVFERYMPLLNFAALDNQTLPAELISAAIKGTLLQAGAKQNPHFLLKIKRDDDFVGKKT